jgi:ABC-type nickel/cobalt efflux system permease component RcnA
MVCVGTLLAWMAASAVAHPLGNDSITHFNVLYILPDRLEVDYLLDIAENPTAAIEAGEIDTNKDGQITQDEQQAWLEKQVRQLPSSLVARIDGTDLPLTLVPEQTDRVTGRKTTTSKIIVPMPGPIGMTYRIVIRYTSRYPRPPGPGEHVLRYEDKTFPRNSGLKLVLLEPNILCQFNATIVGGLKQGPGPEALVDGLAEYGMNVREDGPQIMALPPTAAGEPRWQLTAGKTQLALIVQDGMLSVRALPCCDILAPHPPFVSPDNSVFRYEQYDPMSLPDARAATVRFTLLQPVKPRPIPAVASQPAKSGATTLPAYADKFLDAGYNPPGRDKSQQDARRMIGLLQGRWGLPLLLIVTGTAFAWGAAHALMPGHAKTVVAAYLISQHGTYWHAAVLALIVTITHTALVVILGLVIWLTNPRLGSAVQLWLGLIAGLLVASMGLTLAWRALTGRMDHDHEHAHEHAGPDNRSWFRKLFTHSHPSVPGHVHPHEHEHAHGHPHLHAHHEGREASEPRAGMNPAAHGAKDPGDVLTFRMLLMLGITGGIVPCPTATIIMLLGISAGVVPRALYVIAVFSLGLALTLMGIGALALTSRRYAARVLSDATNEGRLTSPGRRLLLQVVPALSGVVVTVLGLFIAVAYLYRMSGLTPPPPFSWFG